ncbi:MAG: cytochrome c biogenesis protein CcsA [Actinobacteria bacterium]|nr:cytochrome c biogenesis protein CcsA [Actinomycetota bacterium]
MEPATAGSLALWGAIVVITVSLVLPRRRIVVWTGVGLAVAATLALVVALLANDFSLSYVAETTSRATPWPYRLAALWGGMEGSLLFYATLTVLIGMAGTRASVERRVVSLVALGLLVLTALASNPFSTLDIPAVDGAGLLAILQHPAMIYHPPILYLGLTVLVVPFARTVGAVLGGGVDLSWSATTRRWLTASWTLLAVGMVAGANWAYVELGWGGFWAWDPVENTSLMPWLATTVFLHTSMVTDRDGRLRRWTTAMAMVPFALSVLGVYLTRSGVTGSIHAFAEDPLVGRVLLTGAVVTLALVVILATRVPAGSSWGAIDTGRATWLWVSGALVGVVTLFVLVGSAYPAYLEVFWDRTVAVDPGFFVVTILPVAYLIALLVGPSLQTTWSGHGVDRTTLGLFVAGAVTTALLALTVAVEPRAPGLGLGALAGGALLVLARRHRPWPSRLAHFGLAMVLIGAGASSMGTEVTRDMGVGDTVTAGGHRIELTGIETGEGDRFIYAEGVFVVEGGPVLRPQIRAYEDQVRPVAEPVLWSTPARDLILAVSVLSPDARTFGVSVFVRPMVWLVWAGALVSALGGLASWRAGAGGGRRRPARAGRREPGTIPAAIDR